MTIKTDMKADENGADAGSSQQHNETLTVRSNVKAGRLSANHNESIRR
jgi:hypothetical protein